MNTRLNFDSPWSRLPWTLPAALLIWSATLWSLAFFMGRPSHQQAMPPPIDARLIEQPVPVETHKPRPARAAAPHKPKPLPRVIPGAMPKPAVTEPVKKQQVEQKPAAAKPEVQPNPNATGAAHLPVARSDAGAGPNREKPDAVVNPPANGGAQTGPPGGKGISGGVGGMYANGGAQAILRPMPQIPDDLREDAFSSSVLARFHVAADGSAKVELARPTPNPRLNRILLDALEKWRFMPAIKNGKPVASTADIVIRIEVK